MNNLPSFTFRELTKVIKNLLNSKTGWQTIVAYGPPGCGKTVFFETVLRQLYADYLGVSPDKIGLITEKPGLMDATDIAGMRLPKEADETDTAFGFTEGEWMTTDTVPPTLVRIRNTGLKHGILIIDEFGQAANPEQKALSATIDPREHKLGNFDIPQGWIVVATTNRAQDKAGSFRVLSHNTNRVKSVEINVPTEQWVEDYATPNGINPIFVECALAHDDMFAMEVPSEDTPFCTFRSYTVAAHEFSAYVESEDFDGTIPHWLMKSFEATMGVSAAQRVTQWVHRRDKVPTGADIMNDPEGVMVPDETGFQLLAANLAMAEMHDVSTATAALKYVCRLRTDLQVSLGTKLMTVASKAGWFIHDAAAHQFIDDFQQFLPLAYKELSGNSGAQS